MYTIKSDGYIIHSPLFPDELSVLNPALTFELNRQPSLSFRIPPKHRNKGQIKPLLSAVKVYDGSELIFRGRPLSAEDDFWLFREVYCEGDLAMLGDVILRPSTFGGQVTTFVGLVMNEYNSRCGAGKQITLDLVNVPGVIAEYKTDYKTPWQVFEDLIKTFGGYLRLSYDVNELPHLSYTKLSGDEGSQTIRFGQNLLDLTHEQNADSFFTRLIPLGKDTDGVKLTIASVNDGKDYLDSTAVSEYGIIESVMDFSDVELATELKVKGQAALEKVTQTISATVQAVDLEVIDGSIDGFRCGNYYRLISPPHGIQQAQLQLTRCALRLDDITKSTYTFGAVKPLISRRI